MFEEWGFLIIVLLNGFSNNNIIKTLYFCLDFGIPNRFYKCMVSVTFLVL